MTDWAEQDPSADRIGQLLEEIKHAVYEYGEVHRAQGMDENEHQPTLHQHSKYIYGLTKEYLSYDPSHAGIRKLYRWFGQTIRGLFPGHHNLHPEQHKLYHRDIAAGQDDEDNMSDMDPDLMDDSDDEYDDGYGHDQGNSEGQYDQHYDDGYHDKGTEDDCCCGGHHGRRHHGHHDGWNSKGDDGGQDGWDGNGEHDPQDHGDYDQNNDWNDHGEDGQYSHHDGGDYSDEGHEHEHEHEHQHQHQHQGHGQWGDDY
ncbi:uncharacterized protein Z519_06670 [Cladophialophora bantiana CBS 173.52]|uniref:Uncharacterized protein n=1 Tax=Cladophialophora bantiana (strain ATCC 10958 / CBS 173.52 / CDC B-1940 / NIH 8579) TaxID=1442370 RepID=A0A0D2ESG5_CLAB1|nr:uncharacterized protein Z519_06670 [Cladophialophora bantiana CBS 173.52]KIW92821.1 hypothetical protein Z519_06670 [Cladophialophora bantiana CBS 173.52]